MNNTENNENNIESKPKKDKLKDKLKNEIISWVKAIIISLLLVFLLTNFVIINARVPSPSMENTINVNDRFIANRLAYIFNEPERYDIVVFKCPDNDILYVKRIIGLPGETIEIIDGKVYVDGNEEPLRDDFIPEAMIDRNFGPYHVPENHYFMLGDNRNHSEDSRYWENKYVEKNKILGKAVIKYFPKIELLTNK